MLDYFREFQTLATHLNFTTAARELGVSQSCLSRHIAELENEIGFKLLERSPVSLTTAGRRFLSGVDQAMSHIKVVTDECRSIARQEPVTLTIATIIASDYATISMYHALSELHKEFPNLTHSFNDTRKLTIRKTVEAGKADVGILCHAPDELNPAFELEWLFDNPFGAIMHRDDPLAQRPIRFAELSERTVVCSTNRQFTTWYEGMQAACEKYGCAPTFKLKDLDNLADFLISLQPGEVVFARTDTFHPELTNPDLVAVDFSDEQPLTYPNYLLYPKGTKHPVVARFIQLMREEAAKLREQGRMATGA